MKTLLWLKLTTAFKQQLAIVLVIPILCLACIESHAKVWLKRQGSATQLMIDNKPWLILGGEVSNSAATNAKDITRWMPRMKTMNLNTVFVPVYWELVEPHEKVFDFSLVDKTIEEARKYDLKLVLLWFGAWKNSMSCYAPLWFKKDTKRFPRAETASHKPLEIASAFSSNVLEADKNAFTALVRHLKAIDQQQQTVIMLQVENEIGMLEAARDYSPLAEKTYQQPIPTGLLNRLSTQKQTTTHQLCNIVSNKKHPTWQEVFGDNPYGEEIFQAYFYARYVQQLCAAAKAIYPLPMYVNAAMNSRGRKPGEYPSAGPLAHLMEIWKYAAPDIDIYAPDIYDTDFKHWVSLYKRKDNPFFTPETRLSPNSGVRAFYTFGAVDAMSFSPFDIDHADAVTMANITASYDILQQLQPLLLNAQGINTEADLTTRGKLWGVLLDKEQQEEVLEDKDVVMTIKHDFTLPWASSDKEKAVWQEGGALVLKLNKDEYILAGSGVVATFQTASERQQTAIIQRGEDGFATKGTSVYSVEKAIFHGERLGFASIDQVAIDPKGRLNMLRRDNGDQSHQGRYARIAQGEYNILHIKLYRYGK